MQASNNSSNGKSPGSLEKNDSLAFPVVQRCRHYRGKDKRRKVQSTDRNSNAHLKLRAEAINLIFGLPATHLKSWPGILVFCTYLEECFQILLQTKYDVIWRIIGREKPNQGYEAWSWCFAVLDAIQRAARWESRPDQWKQSSSYEASSLEEIYQEIIASSKAKVKTETENEVRHTIRAIFAVICWTSLVMKPPSAKDPLASTKENNLLLKMDAYIRSVELGKFTARPIDKLFRSLLGSPDETSGGRRSTTGTIHASSINFHSLSIISGLKVAWVDSITSHLALDRHNRTLSLFSMPSFCATSMQSPNYPHIFLRFQAESMLAKHDVPLGKVTPLLHRELLWTYRLLFGQSARSRKLARRMLSDKEKRNIPVDSLLHFLCTLPRAGGLLNRIFQQHHPTTLSADLLPLSAEEINGIFVEADSYSAHYHFPIFGSRLLALQEYNLQQQPRRVGDLWRDRRNPLQWHTFWAVIWVGGITIILSFLQVGIAAGQLYFAARNEL